MNYILLVVIVAVCGAAYYTHTQDQQQITTLQAQLDDMQKSAKVAAAAAAANPPPIVTVPNAAAHPSENNGGPTDLTHDLDKPVPNLVNQPASGPTGPHASVVQNPDEAHAGSVDAAADAARAASESAGIGSITTLDNHSYSGCRVIKVEEDGVTFTTDTGIVKIEFALMPPDVQKKFGYSPQGAIARTDAEIRTEEQQQAAQTNTPAPAPAP